MTVFVKCSAKRTVLFLLQDGRRWNSLPENGRDVTRQIVAARLAPSAGTIDCDVGVDGMTIEVYEFIEQLKIIRYDRRPFECRRVAFSNPID